MTSSEYLVCYGLAGDFGRFRSLTPLACRRGAQVVVRSHRGMEAGRVLRAATERHAAFLPNTTLGQLLRLLAPEDELLLESLRGRGRQLLARGRALIAQSGWPLELLDAEVLLDEQHAALHLLHLQECDVRPLVSTLSREFGLHVHIADFSRGQAPLAEVEEVVEASCGSGGCGSGGGCGSAGEGEGEGGGCSTGGCGSCGASDKAAAPAALPNFAALREQMESRRVGLL